MTAIMVPANVEAEAAVLGSILIDPDNAIAKVQAILEPQHFYNLKHQHIYAAFRHVMQRGEHIDYLTVTTELQNQRKLESVGGALYISQLINAVPSAVNVETYARMVYDSWRRRQVINLAEDVAKLAGQHGDDVSSAADYIQARLQELIYAPSTTAPQFQSFAELASTLPKIEWLWQNWLPRGFISLLGAVPGAGKSLLALDLCRRIIHAMPWPDGTPNHEQQNVIYVDGEMVPQILAERAENWNIDLTRLYLMLPNPNDCLDLTRHEYQEKLRSMVSALHPGLVVIDSLSSIQPKGENSVEDVRSLLAYLNDLARTYQTSILLIHHLRKSGGAQMRLPFDMGIDDFRGSGHIIAMARSVMGLAVVQTGPDVDPNGPRKFRVIKTNLCAPPSPLGCELLPMHPTGVTLHWNQDAPDPYKPPTKQDECIEWMADLLRNAEEPMRPSDVVEEAKNEGYSRPLVYRARRALGSQVEDTEGNQSPNNKWAWHTCKRQ